jgi:hypothetical protein
MESMAGLNFAGSDVVRHLRTSIARLFIASAVFVGALAWAQATYAQTDQSNGTVTVSVDREFLLHFSDNLETFSSNAKQDADFGKWLYDFRDLTLPSNPTPEVRKLFDAIRPLQSELSALGKSPNDIRYNILSNIYDLSAAIKQDIAETPPGRPMISLSSHTVEALSSVALSWATNERVLNFLVEWSQKNPVLGTASAGFAYKAAFLGYGPEHLAAGLGRLAGNHDWSDPQTAAELLDGVGKGVWAFVGSRLLGPEGASLGATAYELSVSAGRNVSLQTFTNWYMDLSGTTKTLVNSYISDQTTRLAHGLKLLSFSEYVGNDQRILNAVDGSTIHNLELQLGVPPSSQNRDITVWTNVHHEFYNEACRAQQCIRVNLSTDPLTGSPKPSADLPPRGGVDMPDVKMQQVQSPSPLPKDDVLRRCRESKTPFC